MDRRYFLKSSGIGLASFGLMSVAPNFLHQFANAATGDNIFGKKKTLITIFQRGAVDGLNMVVPHGDGEYYNLRRAIGVPKPKSDGGAIDLDGYFGLNPTLEPLEKFWKSKQLAIVHSVGSPDNTRSHFDAQDYMESATPGIKSTRDGWLNRVLQTKDDKKISPFRAVAMAGQVPRSLMGRAPTIAMTNLSDFAIKAGAYTNAVKGGFEGIWQENVNDSLGNTGKETFEAVNFLKEANPSQYKPSNGANYPNTPFGQFAFADRPTRQSRNRSRSRFYRHARTQLGHARESSDRKRFTRTTCQSSESFRAGNRCAGDRSRSANG